MLPSRTRAFARRMITALDIKTSGPGQSVSDLSGGNQQKVVIARALARDPRVLVAIGPTAGVDVKSKEALLGVVRGVADRGDAAVIVSDELDDLRVCDRVIALFHGRVIAEFGSRWTDRDLVSAMEGLPTGGQPTRLGLDAVDIVYLHDVEDHLPEVYATAFPALARLRDEGVVRAITSHDGAALGTQGQPPRRRRAVPGTQGQPPTAAVRPTRWT